MEIQVHFSDEFFHFNSKSCYLELGFLQDTIKDFCCLTLQADMRPEVTFGFKMLLCSWRVSCACTEPSLAFQKFQTFLITNAFVKYDRLTQEYIRYM